MEVYTSSQSISMVAHIARRVLGQIIECSYQETITRLEHESPQTCYPIFKLI